MNLSTVFTTRDGLLKALLVAISGILLGAWLIYTPSGLLGKADAVGYAVCHRIAARSFTIDGRPISLCARCTGMYLGALLGLVYQQRLGRRGGMPGWKALTVLGLFFLAFAVDGSNSYLHFFPEAPGLYTPTNTLRLLTGTGMGLGIAALVYPTFHQSMWRRWNPKPALATWGQMGALVALSAALDLVILSGNPLALYPLALLGSGTVLLVLTMVYTVVWVMMFKKGNTFDSLRAMWPFLLAGFTTALMQVAALDLLRFALTGTWEGFLL